MTAVGTGLVRLSSTAGLSIALWAVFLAGLRVGAIPPESCGEATPEALDRAAREAVDWMVRNQAEDGRYLYLYFPDADEVPPDYNEVRHAGVTMSLYQAAGRLMDAEALAAADRGLAWMREHLARREGWAALDWPGGRAKLGATALMAAALAERRAATGDATYDSLMRELGRFLVFLQRQDGGFYNGWQLDTGEPMPGTSRYYPGEAFFALTLLDKAFPGEGWGDAARKAAGWLVTRRDDELNVDFPPLADQWTAYGLAELADGGLTEEEAEYARRLAGRWGFFTRTQAQREGGWAGALRGPEARAAGMGTWVEGLAALWRVSVKDERLADLSDVIRERALCAGGILAARQVGAAEAEGYARPALARGAGFRGGETRMDDQQHAFSGLLYTLDALNGRQARAPEEPPFR